MSKCKPYLTIKIDNQCEFCKYGKTYAISEGDYNCDKECDDLILLPTLKDGDVCPHYKVDPRLPSD